MVIVPAGVSATDFGSAARVYWTLKAAGHPAVSILDGGFAAWQAASLSGRVRQEPAVAEDLLRPSSTIRCWPRSKRSSATSNATLLDARPASFFDGRQKAPASKAYGHIPGAINLDSATFYDPATNRLRSKDELAAIAAKLPAGPVVAYCNTGHWAATNWFVLSVMLGRPDVRLYDGSMVEWTADARRPVASSRTRWDDVKKALGFGS